jgi:hypothetical protein
MIKIICRALSPTIFFICRPSDFSKNCIRPPIGFGSFPLTSAPEKMGNPQIIFKKNRTPCKFFYLPASTPPKLFFCPDHTPPIFFNKKSDPLRFFLFAGSHDRPTGPIRALWMAGILPCLNNVLHQIGIRFLFKRRT